MAASDLLAGGSISRGREIFLTGAGVMVGIGPERVPADGRRFACKNCHGIGGAGKREGAAAFPRVDGPALAATDPPYDGAAFARALSEGVAPGGRRLDGLMPRFEMSGADAASLLAYLDALPDEQTRGVMPGEIRFAVVASERFGALASIMADALNARFEELERRGNIHGRRLRAFPVAGRRELDHAGEALAAVGLVSEDAGLAEALAGMGVPNLFPFSPASGDEDPDLLRGAGASRRDAIEALVKSVAGGGRLCVCGERRSVEQAMRSAKAAGLQASAGSVKDCFEDAAAPVMFLSASPLQAERLRGRRILGLMDEVAPQAKRLRASGATLILADVRPALTRKSMAEGISLLAAHATLVAALLENALSAAGRDVTRASLVEAVEGVRVAGDGFPNLDYGLFPLTGARDVELLEVVSQP